MGSTKEKVFPLLKGKVCSAPLLVMPFDGVNKRMPFEIEMMAMLLELFYYKRVSPSIITKNYLPVFS